MTTAVHGSIHALGVKCPCIASDTAYHCKFVVHDFTPLSGNLVPIIDVSLHTSITEFWTHAGPHSFNTVHSEFLTVWFLRFVSNQTLAVCELNVTGNRLGLLTTHYDFNPAFFLAQSRVADSSLTPLRPSTLASNVLPLSGNLLISCVRASPSEPDASSLCWLGSPTLALSRRRATDSCTHKT